MISIIHPSIIINRDKTEYRFDITGLLDLTGIDSNTLSLIVYVSINPNDSEVVSSVFGFSRSLFRFFYFSTLTAFKFSIKGVPSKTHRLGVNGLDS